MGREIKNILILCDVFPPAFAPRMGYLCKYLAEYNWNPIVITEYSPQNIYHDLAKTGNVTYINYYWSGNQINKLKYAFVFLADLFFNYKIHVVKKKAGALIKKNNISLILSSSSCRAYTISIGSQLSRKHKIPFVADLRDIIEQFPNDEHISKKISGLTFINNFISSIITKKLIYQRNIALKDADAITTVSPWHTKILSEFNENVKLIYNGFDADLFVPETILNKQFVITYAGRIESREVKDPSLLFEAVNYLHNEKKINPEILRIHFYLVDDKSKKIVYFLAEKYSILPYLNCFENVQNTEIPKILNNSSILLLLANKSSGEKSPKGIIGTKIFEYLAMEKPILCVRNDEAYIEETINTAQAGFATSNVEEVAEFIVKKYSEWEKTGSTYQAVNKDFVARFSRKRQAHEFVTVFESLFLSE